MCVWVCVDLKYHQVCAAQEHTAAGDCLCVCEDAQLQDTQSETMFLHMLLTVSVHDMICVTSCSGRCHLRPCSTWAGFVSVPWCVFLSSLRTVIRSVRPEHTQLRMAR